ncbi:hypothetical protein [Streptomyces sp. NRRL B-24720]|uniref:hypothetical protein n=1 Tax=Streptomyces sp. NRRL B-24720 TaxID=1476876 RepID=UPI0004CA04B0|nr:hypothetical protein [Streptomyces sp. NRRL B-24720]
MGDRPSTFGGTWTRPRQDGVGRSQRELQDRASYDCAPAAGMSCSVFIIAAPLAAAMWWGLYEGATALIGAIA